MKDWTQKVEVLWNKEKTQSVGMIVDGEKLTMEEYHEKYPLDAKSEMKEVKKKK